MRLFILLIGLSLFGFQASAQKFQSSKSYVKFFSSAPLEDIKAENYGARSIIDVSTGELVYSVQIKDFDFEKDLMQEHFNENYMESEKYPKSTLSGKIKNWNGQKGEQDVTVEGKLLIHGVTKDVTIDGKINYQDDLVKVSAVFFVALEDYKVKIPKAVFYKIAERVEVTVEFEYKPL